MRLLHVTDVFPGPEFPIPEEALYRGRYVHAVLDLLDKGKTLAEPVHEPWRGYVEAWQRAKRELRIVVLASEEQISDSRGYCGTRDKRVTVAPRRGQGIVDLKLCSSCTGAVPWSVGLQTAGYVGEEKLWRAACVLHPDETYRWYDDQTNKELFRTTDRREFLARLYVMQQDIARGLREWPAERED